MCGMRPCAGGGVEMLPEEVVQVVNLCWYQWSLVPVVDWARGSGPGADREDQNDEKEEGLKHGMVIPRERAKEPVLGT